MKKSIDETAERFDRKSGDYDETRSDRHYRAVDGVVERAISYVSTGDTVVDIGAGTGMVSFRIAPHAGEVIALDISEGMLEEGRNRAREEGVDNITFARGSFRRPEEELDLPRVDCVVSNFAMHHLSDDEKREAFGMVSELLDRRASGGPGRFVLGDVILFEEIDNPSNHFNPDVDDPATVEVLEEQIRKEGFVLEEREKHTPSSGILVAKKTASS